MAFFLPCEQLLQYYRHALQSRPRLSLLSAAAVKLRLVLRHIKRSSSSYVHSVIVRAKRFESLGSKSILSTLFS